MTKLAVFSFGNHEIRTVSDEHGEVWFVAADVCSALEHTNPTKAVADHVDDEDKANFQLGLPGRAPTVVNESGLYALIFGSRKESAKRFKRWVTSEVLPAIRKKGYYAAEFAKPAEHQRIPTNDLHKKQWHDCPPRSIEEDIRKVEALVQFAGLSRSDKMVLLVRTVRQHDEYFASIVALASERVKDLERVKNSPDAIEHNLSAR